MSAECSKVIGIWPCENETPGHTTHFVDDLTGKQRDLFERALDEILDEQ